MDEKMRGFGVVNSTRHSNTMRVGMWTLHDHRLLFRLKKGFLGEFHREVAGVIVGTEQWWRSL